jgi:ABC-type phosphate transport system auxiliary subunit
MNRSVPIRLNQCTYCQKSLHQQQDIDKKQLQQQQNKFIIFACRHVFHLRCLMDIQTEGSNNNFCPQCTIQQSATTVKSTPLVRPELRRLTTVYSDQNERQIYLNNTQQQVITAILERKRLNAHHLKLDDDDDNEQIRTTIEHSYSSSAPLQLPDKWREYLSSSE